MLKRPHTATQCLTDDDQCLTDDDQSLTDGAQCLTDGDQCLTDDEVDTPRSWCLRHQRL